MRVEMELRDRAGPFLTDVQKRQIPFATKEALNATALDFQKAQRARLGTIFTLRRKAWAERSIKISPFATKSSPLVRIAVEAPGDKSRSDILGKFETDTSKVAKQGTLAVPVEARRTKAGLVQERDKPRRVIDEGRAFIRKVGGRTFIFERLKSRTAKKLGRAIRLLYTLVRAVPIKPELEFVKTARKTVGDRWGFNFRKAFEKAMRTAKR